jgi:multidrug efflux pump subunit AcrB
MVIKNGIVLVDQISLEINEGKPRFKAIIDSAASRVRPVSMAAATTILGMVPLLWDIFFKDMAVTIMFGLGFATLLALILVPVFYAVIFKVKESEQ